MCKLKSVFEPGRLYVFSKHAFYADMPGVGQKIWVEDFDGVSFVGLGGHDQVVIAIGMKARVVFEWCVEGEAEVF